MVPAEEPHGAQVEADTPQLQVTGSTPRPDAQGADPPTLLPAHPLPPVSPSHGVVIQKLVSVLCQFVLILSQPQRARTSTDPFNT